MDKKEAALLEQQFNTAEPDNPVYHSIAEIELHLAERKQAYDARITEERLAANFEERYKNITHLNQYDIEFAFALYREIGFIGVVSNSIIDNILTIGIYSAYKTGDMSVLKNALHTKNRLKYGHALTISGGYNHSGAFDKVIDAFADGDLDLVKKYLPEKSGLADKRSHNFFRAASNLVMSMLYARADWLEESTALAEKFNAQKSSGKYDILVTRYLMALSRHDMQQASLLLQEIADNYRKTAWIFNFRNPFLKFFGVYVHGLYNLASFVLPSDKFSELKTPVHSVFWKKYDEYTKSVNCRPGESSLPLQAPIHSLRRLFEISGSTAP